MALYGSVPIIVSTNGKHSVGLFYFNPTETFVDVLTDDEESRTAHFISESGVLDLFFLPGPTPSSVFSQYATITGRTPLPPLFALGYHQCRWNYRDEKDVYQVHDQFEDYDYPYDVLWLDIEHTNDKRYFTWNYDLFPTPKAMQNKLKSQGRKMVTIVDPHIKRDDNYYIHKTATSKGYYIKKQDGRTDYDGWCWPGSSSYLDFTSEKVRDWFASQFAYDVYKESTPTLHTWNDMNEPSVFNGPEVSMQKDLLNLAGVEHREWHNLYGMLFHRATHEGLIKRNRKATKERGFVLSRAFFAGSQRYGAIWTGDNAAEWSHLAIATPMLLSLNIGGIFFSGADVGGFFKDTTAELMTRWMQAGAYQPFFRGHAHHDTKRKEPWVYGEDTLMRLRKVALERYALLPYWYTVFRYAMTTGMPVMRTLWMEYPKETLFFDVDDQYFVGEALMVKPVTEEGATHIRILFPLADLWYDVHTLAKVQLDQPRDNGGVQEITVPTSMDEIPVYQRGGTIVPRKLRLRRSSALMTHDPYTLYIALTKTATARGELYIDDEHTFDYEKGAYCLSTITADFKHENYIQSRVEKGDAWTHRDDIGLVERIVVMGLESRPKMVSVGKKETSFVYNDDTAVLVIKLPNVHVTLDWDMSLVF
jgi:alpha 1,3-glucosidase